VKVNLFLFISIIDILGLNPKKEVSAVVAIKNLISVLITLFAAFEKTSFSFTYFLISCNGAFPGRKPGLRNFCAYSFKTLACAFCHSSFSTSNSKVTESSCMVFFNSFNAIVIII
jgi:hypothetical protein